MAGKGDTFENDLLKLILWGTLIANLAQNAVSAPLTVLWLALHTADPGDAGVQTTNEVTYTSYARISVSRDSAGFTITGNSATLTADMSFPAGTGGAGTATFFSLGTAASGAGKILYSGAISPTIVLGNGVTPMLTVGTTITED